MKIRIAWVMSTLSISIFICGLLYNWRGDDVNESQKQTVYVDNQKEAHQNKAVDEKKIYSNYKDFINNYSDNVIERLAYKNGIAEFKLSRTVDRDYKDIMEDVAKNLGAICKNGSYLYTHELTMMSGNYAYFGWRFFLNDLEYVVYVKTYDHDNFFTVGVSKYKDKR